MVLGGSAFWTRVALVGVMFAAIGSSSTAADEHFKVVEGPVSGAGAEVVLREVRDQVAIFEVQGEYSLADDSPRAAAMQQFYSVLPDQFDFVAAFSTFDFDTGGALAFATLIQNDVQGIGLPLFDNSADFGSAGRLQSFIDMKNLAGWSLSPLDPDFETALSALMHEIQHRWGSHVEYRTSGGTLSDGLLGLDGSHWSYLLDSDASVHYGADWQDNGDGSFTSLSVVEVFSPLDLYLAGLISAAEVPPMLLIDSPAVDREQLPQLGATVTGAASTVTIGDIVAAEGPRVPSEADAPREFGIAFVLLVRPGEVVTDAQMVGLQNIRREAAVRFAVLSGGRGLLHVEPPPDDAQEPGAPGEIEGGDLSTAADLAAGLNWLRAQQKSDGSFEDTVGTRWRDTTTATEILSSLDPDFDPSGALVWLSGQTPIGVDAIAREERLRQQLELLSESRLPTLQHQAGGFGVDRGFDPDPLDTALALRVLAGTSWGRPSDAVGFLLQHRNGDGGWSPVVGGASRTGTTVAVLEALARAGISPPAESVSFLLGRQNPDGGFGDSPSTSHDTAGVLQLLASIHALPDGAAELGLAYLRSRQTVEGSWDGSVFATSLALAAWSTLLEPPPIAIDLAVQPEDLVVGGDLRLGAEAEITLTVRNLGSEPAGASVLRVSVVDSGETREVYAEMIQVGGLGEVTRLVPWHVDRVGDLELRVEVDALDQISEADETNNQAEVAFQTTILDEINWALDPSSVVSWPDPAEEGSPLTVEVQVLNTGGVDAPAGEVALFDGDPDTVGIEVARVAVPALSAGASHLTVVQWPAATPVGSHTLVVRVDPDALHDEFREDDNQALLLVEVASNPDPAIADSALHLSPSRPAAAQPVQLDVLVSNLGQQAVDSLTVRLLQGPGVGLGVPVVPDQITHLPASSTALVSFDWIHSGGTHVLTVVLDPEDLVSEGSESNNQASIGLSEPEGDFFVSERYFSPDGDGVQDTTRFFFQLTAAETTSISVRAERGNDEVLAYQGPELEMAEVGSYEWDGRDATGRVVADGEYRIELRSLSGQVLGLATATVDTNRRPLLEAAGTLFERTVNPTCAQPTVDHRVGGESAPLVLTRDEGWMYYRLSTGPGYEAGLYRMRPDGRSPHLILADEELPVVLRDLALSPSGDALAFSGFRTEGGVPSTYLYLADADGSNLQPIWDLGLDWEGSILGFSSATELLVTSLVDRSILAFSTVTGGAPGIVYTTLADWVEVPPSPGIPRQVRHPHLLIHEIVEGEEDLGILSVLDLATGETEELDSSEFSRINAHAWSEDGAKVAISFDDAPAVAVYQGGQLTELFGEPGLSGGGQHRTAPASGLRSASQPLLESLSYAPSWAENGKALAYVGRIWHPECEEDAEAVLVGTLGAGLSVASWTDASTCVSDLEVSVASGGWVWWDAGTPSLLYAIEGGFNASTDRRLWALHLDQERRATLGDDAIGYQPRFGPSGGSLRWVSEVDAENPESPCFGQGLLDFVAYESLMNLTVDLKPRQTTDGPGYRLEGTAVDLNLLRWWIEYENAAVPGTWHPLALQTEHNRIDGFLTSWIPPTPGTFNLRLVAEDRAGNRRSSTATVSSAQVPTIVDLSLERHYFSPNGDGVFDTVQLDYEVLRAAIVELEVRDQGGSLVRTLQTQHLGPESSTFVWDGRNEGGTFVDDGRYLLLVDGAEFEVVVDTVAPVFDYANLMQEVECQQGSRQVTTTLDYLVEESSLSDGANVGVEISRADWSAPDSFEYFSSALLPQMGALGVGSTPLSLQDSVGARFRLRASDRAGNQGFASTPFASEVVRLERVVAIDPDTQSPVGPEWLACEATGAPSLGAAVSLRAFESVARPIHEVYGQFQSPPIQAGAWQEVWLGPPSVTPDPHQFEVDWLLDSLEGPQVLRLRTRDAGGGNAFSEPLMVVVDAGPVLGSELEVLFVGGDLWRDLNPFERQPYLDLLADLGLDPHEDGLIVGRVSEDLDPNDVSLLVESPDDPYYFPALGISLAGTSGSHFAARLGTLVPCTGYLVEASIEGATGRLEASEALVIGCLEIAIEEGEAPEGACGSGPVDSLRPITITPSTHDGSVLGLLTVSGPNEVGEPEVLFSRVDPLSGEPIVVEVDRSLPPEGEHEYLVELTTVDGEIEEAALDWTIDHTPPTTVEIVNPVGGVVCPGPDLRVRGQIEDNFGTTSRWDVWENEVPRLSGGQSCSGSCPDQVWADLTDSTFVQLGEPPLSGSVRFRAETVDAGGFKECRETLFVVDRTVEAAQPVVDLELISPNADGVNDSVAIDSTSFEAVTMNSVVEGPIMPGSSPLVATLIEDHPLDGPIRLVWDGLSDTGSLVSDGSYDVVTTFHDGCVNRSTSRTRVVVDTLPPNLELVYPTAADPLTTLVEVVGVVSDLHLEQWWLEYGVGWNPTSWAALGTGDTDATGLLASWNTFGLQGEVSLRLRARDGAGNESSVVELLTLDPTEVVTSLEVSPTLFSPNGDGRRESAELRFALAAAAQVDVQIVREDGSLVRSLVLDASYPAGVHLISWDGRGDDALVAADARYRFHLAVRLQSNPLVTQTEQISVGLDQSLPVLQLDTPSGPFEPASFSVHGSLADPHLTESTLSLSEDVAPPVWAVLYSGTESRTDYDFASVADLEEGNYLLRVVARDAAENYLEEIVSFTVDGTPPLLTLTQPEAGTVFGAIGGEVPVTGTLADDYLAYHRLELGVGASPSAWTVVAEGASLPVPEPLWSWDLTSEPDGPRVLRWTAADLAGNESRVETAVTVDNTAPVADLQAPTFDDWVTGPVPVLGSAVDDNLDSYTVALAPGSPGDSQLFSPLGNGAEPVVDGTLVEWAALPSDGEYTLRLRVEDVVGHRSEVLSAVRVDQTPPSAPLSLTAVVVGERDGQLTWASSPSADTAGYRVFRDGLPLVGEPIPDLEWLDAELPDGQYSYTVTAIDRAGWESDPSPAATLHIDSSTGIASIHHPASGARVGGTVEITGTASAENLDEYRVLVQPLVGPAVVLRRSSVEVFADTLAQWSTVGLPEEQAVQLRLEVENAAGQVVEDSVLVTIDNVAPAAPVGLAAVATGADVDLTWNPSPEPDLAGYLLYRDDQLVNADGPVIGDLTTYLLSESSYRDLDRPDGTFEYLAYAVDEAGNSSPPSNSAAVSIDLRAPHAMIVEPEAGQEFDGLLEVVAEIPDTDVVEVLFEWRPLGSSNWLAVGPAPTEPPWSIVFDPEGAGLSHGDQIELRAVAEDASGNIDPAPEGVAVIYADLTPPPAVEDLSIAVDGGQVELSWSPVTAVDLAGYLVDREDSAGVVERVTPTALTDSAFDDEVAVDDDYRYFVVSVDESGNESAPAVGLARVYSPTLVQPFTPVSVAAVDLEGQGDPGVVASGTVVGSTASVPLAPVPTSDQGDFSWSSVPLEVGSNRLEVVLEDGSGNRSRSVDVTVVRGDVPTVPTGLNADSPNPFEVALAWDPNPEADLLGYRLLRNGEPLPSEAVVSFVEATASSTEPGYQVHFTVDGLPDTFWSPALPAWEEEWVEWRWAEPRTVHQIDVDWGVGVHPGDYDLLVWSGSSWISLLEIRDGVDPEEQHRLVDPYRTDRLRLVLRTSSWGLLDEVRVYYHPLLATASYLDLVPDGLWEYSVIAATNLGFESAPSDPVAQLVGDTEPPEPVVASTVVAGADVTVEWSASPSPDVATYEIYRDDESLAVRSAVDPRHYLDAGRPNGIYDYTVIAIDAVGNRSVASNVATAIVALDLLGAPQNLEATVPPSGVFVDLSWLAPLAGEAPGYEVFRGLQPGGPGELIGSTPVRTLRDDEVELGATYYYTVRAVDPLGNLGLPSNEVRVDVIDTEAPTAPRIFWPTVPGQRWSTEARRTEISLRAEPGSSVELSRDGVIVATEVASTGLAARLVDFWPNWSTPASPDGRWLPNGLELLDLDAVAVTPLPFDEDARWFGDSRRLAVAAGNRIEIVDRHDGPLAQIPVARAQIAVPSPRGDKLAVVGEQGSLSGLLLYDLHEDVWTELVGAGWWAIEPSSVRWSPQSDLIAYDDVANLRVRVVEAETATTRFESGAPAHGPSWSPDGSSLAFTLGTAQGQKLVVFDLGLGSSVDVTDGVGSWAYPAAWSPDGGSVVYWIETSEAWWLERRPAIGGQPEVLIEDAETFFPRLDWSAQRGLLVRAEDSVRVLQPAGTTTFDAVTLPAGTSTFDATATDASGNRSADSEAIEIERLQPARPDLSVRGLDLTLLPAVSQVGEPTVLAARIENLGVVGVPEVGVSVGLRSSLGEFYPVVENAPIGGVPGAGHRIVSWVLPVEVDPGAYDLVVVVDPLGAVLESDETNNRAQIPFFVQGGGGEPLGVYVETDESTYAAGQDVSTEVTAVNFGSPTNATIEVVVEDATGFQIELLARQDLALDFAESWTWSGIWQPGDILAGSYRIVARRVDPGATESGLAAFEIRPQWSVEVEVAPGPASFEVGEVVPLVAHYDYLAGNTALPATTVQWSLEVPGVGVVESWEAPLGDLVPGATGSAATDWSAGSVGTFTARAELWSEGQHLGSGLRSFEVMEPPGGLIGRLQFDDPVVASGFPLVIHSELTNDTLATVGDLTLRLSARFTVGSEPEILEEFSVTLASGASTLRRTVVDTSGWPLGSHLVRLEAWQNLPGEPGWILLAGDSVSLFDGSPPEVATLIPRDGQIVGPGVLARVSALDALSEIEVVEGRFDAGSWLSMNPSLESGVYTRSLEPLAEGPHRFQSRASDRAGLSALTPEVNFVIDRTAPEIFVTGVEDGGVYELPVVPQVVVTDLHLAETLILLDGEDWVAGTTVSEPGDHWLLATAADQAGNTSSLRVDFHVGPFGSPLLAAKSWLLEDDADGSGAASAGDTLRYTITVTNEGPLVVAAAAVADELAAELLLVPGSVSSPDGTLLSESPVTMAWEDLEVGAERTVSFSAVIDPLLSPTITEIANQATIYWDDQTTVSDDPLTPEPLDPTVVSLSEVEASFSVTGSSVLETEGAVGGLLFTVVLDQPLVASASVGFQTAGVTAEAGVDYLSASGTLVFPPGIQTQEVVVEVLDDLIDEPDEMLNLVLSGSSGPSIAVALAAGEIQDDDAPPGLSLGAVALTEGDSGSTTVSVPVALTQPSAFLVSVDYASSDLTAVSGVDYLAVAGTVDFLPGTTVAEVAVEVLGDLLDESDETFLLVLSNAVYGSILEGDAEVTIIDDDDPPALAAVPVTSVEGDTGTTVVSVPIVLDPPSGIEVTVQFTTLDGTAEAGTDYVAVDGSLVFAPGETEATVEVSVLGDDLVEPDEWFEVSLYDAVGATIAEPQAQVVIVNDDGPPALAAVPVTTVEGDTGTMVVSVPIVLDPPSGIEVTVQFTTLDGTAEAGTDYVAVDGSLVFAPGETEATVEVSVLGDDLVEPDEWFEVSLYDAVGATIAEPQAQVLIVNDDGPSTLAAVPVTSVEGDTGTTVVSVPIVLDPPSGIEVTVQFTTLDGTAEAGTDYVAVDGSLTFAPGETEATVEVSVLGDDLVEPDEWFEVSLYDAVGATISGAEAQIVIVNDDEGLEVVEIPTLGSFGHFVLWWLLAGAGAWMSRRRQAAEGAASHFEGEVR